LKSHQPELVVPTKSQQQGSNAHRLLSRGCGWRRAISPGGEKGLATPCEVIKLRITVTETDYKKKVGKRLMGKEGD